MTTLVVGADVSSTKVALVGSDLTRKFTATRKYDLMERSGPESCAWAMKVLTRWIGGTPSFDKHVLYIEAPVVAGSRNIQSTIKQSYVNGVVQAVFANGGYEVIITSINEWKKELIKGGASKEVVAQALAEQWPLIARSVGQDQDLIDAGAICHYGLRRQGH